MYKETCRNMLFNTGKIIQLCLFLLLLGCTVFLKAGEVCAKEKVIVKGVPFFHQRWHFD